MYDPFQIREPLPKISKLLLPWLIVQRKEIIEGCHYFDVKTQSLIHDGSGLDRVRGDLKSVTAKLAGKNSVDVTAILNIQLKQVKIKIEYYEWRLNLIDRIIEVTK